jgi:hypothetical protein
MCDPPGDTTGVLMLAQAATWTVLACYFPPSGLVKAPVWVGLLAGVWQSHTSALDRMPDG